MQLQGIARRHRIAVGVHGHPLLHVAVEGHIPIQRGNWDAHLIDGGLFVLGRGHQVDRRAPARLLPALAAWVINLGAQVGADDVLDLARQGLTPIDV